MNLVGPENQTLGRSCLTMVKKSTMGWESRKWPPKVTLDSPLVKDNSFSCLGGFTFGAKAQENEYNSREMGNFSKGEGDTNWR